MTPVMPAIWTEAFGAIRFCILSAGLYSISVKSSRSTNNLTLLPLGVALVLSLSAAVVTATAAVFAPHPGIPAGEPPLGNALGVARSYLFRNAAQNSAWVAAGVFAGVFLLARLAQPRLGSVRDMRRSRLWLPAIALSPLFLPLPFAALLWQPLFGRIDMVSRPAMGLLAVALVSIWRLWPLAMLLSSVQLRTGPNRAALVTAMAAVWLALIDVGTPLVVTGGEPFNEAHLWASWAFHTVWVSRLWGHGAVMAGGLAIVCGILGAAVIWTLTADSVDRIETQTDVSAPSIVIFVAGVFAALVPVCWAVLQTFSGWEAGLLDKLLSAGYVRWAGNTLVAIAIACVIAGIIVLPLSAAGPNAHRRLFCTALVMGCGIAPIWGWLLIRRPIHGLPAAQFAIAAAVAGITAGLISVLPAAWASSDGSTSAGNRRAVLTVLVAASLTIGNLFPLWVAAGEQSLARTLGAGVAMTLGSARPAVYSLAALCTFGLTALAATAITYAWASLRDAP